MNSTLSRVPLSKQLRLPQLAPHERVNLLRRAYFASALAHARWRVDVECVIAHVESSQGDATSWRVQPKEWIEDVVIACACVGGDQQAWHTLQLANTWRLREVAELRMSPSHASLLVERFWRELRVRSVGQQNARHSDRKAHRGLCDYRGGETLSRWLLSQVLARVESLDTSVDAILDTMPQLRTLGFDASESARMPQAT